MASMSRTWSRGHRFHAAGTPARLRREHVSAQATVTLPALPPLPQMDLPRRELPERVLRSFVSKTIDFGAIGKAKAA